jgi:glycosyltransferase involved in cell wall biosynthesis
MAELTLSVVMPVYNEVQTIEQLVTDLERDVVLRVPGTDVIVVDDHSSDGSGALLDMLAESRPWLRVEHAPLNLGHGPSVIAGLELAPGQWVFQLDSDAQFLVSEFEELWSRRDTGDLLLGVRIRRRDPLHRLVLSRLIEAAVSVLAGRRLRDVNTPFRLVRRELWEDLRPQIARTTLAPSILVTLGAAVRGWRIVEVPVTHLPRATGASSLRAWRLLSFSLRGLAELGAYRWRVRRLPLRLQPRPDSITSGRSG